MKVAAVQAAPVFLNPKATTEKAVGLIGEAAANGARLCVFPEAFISGYPLWLGRTNATAWNDQKQKTAYQAYIDSSFDSQSAYLQTIVEKCRQLDMFTYVGFLERSRSRGTVYCSLAAIHPEKGIVSIHRKLMSTFHERLIWANGDGNGLQVHEWSGCRVGGLNCYENWMPLARYCMYAQGEEVHVATWPGTSFLTPDITRFIALEGRVFVVSSAGILRSQDVPDSFPFKQEMFAERDPALDGGTLIVGPDGQSLAGPIAGEEAILYADLDLSLVREERQMFDPAGHYARPDVFSLTVDRRRLEPLHVQTADSKSEIE